MGMIFFKTNRRLDASLVNDIPKVRELTLMFLDHRAMRSVVERGESGAGNR